MLVAAREAHDSGVTVTELDTSWLSTPPEEAVIQARIEASQEDAQAEHVSDEVNKVLDALRTAGYEPSLRIEDVEYHGGGPVPAWTPAQPNDTTCRPPGHGTQAAQIKAGSGLLHHG